MIKIGLTDFTPENKLINIRDKNQVIKAKYAIGKNDVWKYSLMNEHYIEISFELNRNVLFKRSDYIEWEGEKFTLREDYQPEQINKRKYKYALKFEAIEMFFQDIQYYYLNQGLKESEWSLTGNPEYFLKIGVDNINRYFNTTEFKVGTIEPTEVKFITFDTNTNVFDALTQIADAYSAEWHMEGKTIHLLNKVSFGDEVDFETDVSVLSMDRQEGESSTRYTRIVPLGSTRNIPKDYRQTTPGEGVDAIYPKRLRIPANKGDVIDAYPNMSPDEVVEGTVIFDEVYPKRVGTIEAVGTIEYQDKDEETGEVTKWNAYKIKDSGINFKEEYVLPGEELRLRFVSGDLNGFDFPLLFHKDGFSNSDNSQYFEIKRTEDYGKLLPNDIMKPKAGDQYVLYGFNIALVSDQYVPAGELELYDTAKEWMQNQLKDTSVYECETVIKHFFDNQMDLAIGQKVRLVFDDEKASTRSSRIMGFEKKLNNKFDAIYTVGDNSTYSRLANIEKEIKELQVAGVVYEATGGGGVYVIKQFDSTRPTDFNVYSAKASDAKYFNKQIGGTVQGDTTFAKNMQVQGIGIGDVFQNSTFKAGQLGNGWQIKRDANGQSYLEVDNIMVRREAVFNRLTIAEIKSVGGTILLSLANMLVSKVEDKTSTWKCFFDTADGTIPNDFAVGDQAICRKFTGKNIKYYWAKVTAVGVDYIELSKTDKDGSGIPAIGDEVVQLGNRTDVNRQYAIMLSTYGSAAPSINQYSGINSYDLTGKEVTTISPKGNSFTGQFYISTHGTTAPVYKEVGVFKNGTVYYLNDRVSYLGSYWVCIVDSTIQTPNETSVVWRKDTIGQTDINKVEVIANNAQKEAEKVRSEYQADFILLDTKIASKVSQTDFNALGGRVSTAESNITQLSGSITSVVEKVDDIQVSVRNYLLATSTARTIIGLDRFNQVTVGYNIVNGSLEKANLLNKNITLTCKYKVEGLDKETRMSFVGDISSPYFGETLLSSTNSEGEFTSTVKYGSTHANSTRINIRVDNLPTYATVKITEMKLSLVNRDNGWNPAQEDIEKEISDAQNTANLKNRTYYQDETPTVPSGGHKVGDLWYMNSLVDINGNINADSSKNKYQLQRRWNGSTWVRINWSASTSVIEQTDSNINLLVEKTGINDVGSGSSLFSMIQLLPNQIKLEVSKVQIGGVNLVANSQGIQKVGGSGSAANKSYRFTDLYAYLEAGKQYTFSCKTDGIWGGSVGVDTVEAHLMKDKSTIGGFVSTPSNPHTFIAPQTGNFYIRIDANKGDVEHSFWEFQVEEGNKPTPWKLSEGDRQAQIDKAQNTADSKTTLDEVSSSLTLVDNKITLASKTIELKGTTIAKAIEAEDLKVGSRSGLSTLEVLKDGTFYAKGSDSSNSSLIIDSKNRSIEIKSPKSTSHDGSSISGSSNVTISSESGGVRVDGSTIVSSNSAAIVSNSGIFANTAGQFVAGAGTSISESRASIVGLGWGNITIDHLYGKDNFVAGVYGRASNSGNAPAYGGYFDVLRANGLVLSMIDISDGTTAKDQYTSLTKYTTFVLGNSKVMQTVYLPNDAYKGTVIWFKQWWTGYMRIRPRGTHLLFDDRSQNDYIDVGEGWNAMCVFVGNHGTGAAKYGTWMISKWNFY